MNGQYWLEWLIEEKHVVDGGQSMDKLAIEKLQQLLQN